MIKRITIRFIFSYLLFFITPFSLVSQTKVDSLGHSYEHITSYHSDLIIQKNTHVKIKETINVLALGQEIKHGIYRDIPLSYNYRGGSVKVGFDLLNVKMDGKKTDYHTEFIYNGIRIYIGSKEKFVEQGHHTYEITYDVHHVLGDFENYDEFTWNINGNGWYFSIDSISANVYTPQGAKIIQYNGFTGVYGSTEKNYTSMEIEGGIRFIGTEGLDALENLTVSVAWEKGHLIYPTPWEEFIYFIQSYMLWIIGVLGILLGFTSNFIKWFRFGRDPKPGTIIPLFYPPTGFSPAECIYLKKAGKPSDDMFGSTLISLAVKGYINIEVKNTDGDTVYIMTKVSTSEERPKKALTDIEQAFFNTIFSSKDLFIIKEGKFNKMVVIANELLEKKIEEKQNEVYIQRNSHLKTSHFIVPLLILIAGGLAYWFYGGMFGIIIGAIILQFLLNYLFGKLYEQPTKEGRKKMDEIAGFEMYLKYADSNRIKALNPPTLNFEHFEENLAFAIALGVANEWTNKFKVLNDISDFKAYHVPYLTGISLASTGSISSSLSQTISSASTPPSSSGSFSGGGGGFSGGGGGGGGGGGW